MYAYGRLPALLPVGAQQAVHRFPNKNAFLRLYLSPSVRMDFQSHGAQIPRLVGFPQNLRSVIIDSRKIIAAPFETLAPPAVLQHGKHSLKCSAFKPLFQAGSINALYKIFLQK